MRVRLLSGLMLAAAAAQAQSYTVLYSFTGETDGAYPKAALVRDTSGNFYGTTYQGGTAGCKGCGFGVLFELDAAGNLTPLHAFTGGAQDGAGPRAPVLLDSAGNLYGTTVNGGASDYGVVFKFDTAGKFTLLHTFTGRRDGGHPYGTLISDSAGNLYGTTAAGGKSGCASSTCGVVYKLSVAGSLSVLHAFAGGADGGVPLAGLTRDSFGNLYGTTSSFGNNGNGTVFKLDSHGNLTAVYSFGGPDGAQPMAGVVRDPAGNLYGTTHGGGEDACEAGCGIVYRVDPSGNLTLLHSFTGGPDGASPVAGLIRDAAGNLYGDTPTGGASNDGGVVFKIDAAGNFTVLHTFINPGQGLFPSGGLLLSGNALYGTTSDLGPDNSLGVVFQLQ